MVVSRITNICPTSKNCRLSRVHPSVTRFLAVGFSPIKAKFKVRDRGGGLEPESRGSGYFLRATLLQSLTPRSPIKV